MSLIRITHLTKQFGEHTAVDNISLEVKEGETLVLLGTSGCGKTTTLKMINRLIEPTSGTIEIKGMSILGYPVHELRRQIGYVIQETGLFPHYTVAENIAVVPRLLQWKEEVIHQRILELLMTLQLPESCLGQYPDQLSGGQRQRVGLARALAAKPPIILMDEPLGALDPITRSGIREEFKTLAELRQKTIILVTHDVQEAFELGDRICLMDKGRIQQLDTPKNLLLKPANAFVRNFFKEQRWALQLRVFSLGDLAAHLSGEAFSISSNPSWIDEDTTVATALESIFEKEGQSIAFRTVGRDIQLGYGDILSAFQRAVQAYT